MVAIFFFYFFCIRVVYLRVHLDTISLLILTGRPLIRFSVGEMLNLNRDESEGKPLNL